MPEYRVIITLTWQGEAADEDTARQDAITEAGEGVGIWQDAEYVVVDAGWPE